MSRRRRAETVVVGDSVGSPRRPPSLQLQCNPDGPTDSVLACNDGSKEKRPQGQRPRTQSHARLHRHRHIPKGQAGPTRPRPPPQGDRQGDLHAPSSTHSPRLSLQFAPACIGPPSSSSLCVCVCVVSPWTMAMGTPCQGRACLFRGESLGLSALCQLRGMACVHATTSSSVVSSESSLSLTVTFLARPGRERPSH